ncbi:MAG: L-threonine 3-dehydrogenase, partial [Planctomycetaceae bacterium]|nr:L-threonine 3-dehydrogenase [Planctomycetaceae bacterium]
MKALAKSKAEQGLWLVDVDKPTYGINDVLIRIDRTGI